MKRRDFLKILSAAPLVAAVPVLAKTDMPSRLTTHTYKNEYPSSFIDAMPHHVAKSGETMARGIEIGDKITFGRSEEIFTVTDKG